MSHRLRGILTVVGGVGALLAAGWSSFAQQSYAQCVGAHQRADAARTSAIAKATDEERRAQRALLANTDPNRNRELRAAILTAYDHTDAVRAANPPPSKQEC